jgi:lipoate-protein ligase A
MNLVKAKAQHKVPGGKMLQVELELDCQEHTIHNIKITGDFFMHPEEMVYTLELLLTNLPAQRVDIARAVRNFFAQEVEVIGAGEEDFVELLMKCIESARA